MPKRLQLQSGDVFSILTKSGYGFIQYLETSENGVEFVRVLQRLLENELVNQTDVNIKERFIVQFPVKPAYNRSLIQFIDHFKIPEDFHLPTYFRTPHIVRGVLLGWHIINKDSLKRTLVNKLTTEQHNLSPYGIYNDILLKEKIENNWKLEKWV